MSKRIAICTAVLGLIAAVLVLVVRYFEIQKAKAEADYALAMRGSTPTATTSIESDPNPNTVNERLRQAAWANRKWWRDTAGVDDVVTVAENGKVIHKVGDRIFVHHLGDNPNEFIPETSPLKDTVEKWRVASSTDDELVLVEHQKLKKGFFTDTPPREVVLNYKSLESEKWRRTRNALIWLGVAVGLFVVGGIRAAAQSRKDPEAGVGFGCCGLVVLVIALVAFGFRLALNWL